MSLPPLIREGEATDAAWQRKARDAMNSLIRRVMGQGVTAERPKNPDLGTMFYDVTLAKPIWWAGTAWRDAAGTIV